MLEKNFKDISSCSQVSINRKQCVDHQEKSSLFVRQLDCLAGLYIAEKKENQNSFSAFFAVFLYSVSKAIFKQFILPKLL